VNSEEMVSVMNCDYSERIVPTEKILALVLIPEFFQIPIFIASQIEKVILPHTYYLLMHTTRM
jgi:hypothetical protein